MARFIHHDQVRLTSRMQVGLTTKVKNEVFILAPAIKEACLLESEKNGVKKFKNRISNCIPNSR